MIAQTGPHISPAECISALRDALATLEFANAKLNSLSKRSA
jgi:hypothetical protein